MEVPTINSGRSKYNPNLNVNPVPGGFRGRGGPMRGGYDRGRGRGRGTFSQHPMMGGGMRGGMMGGPPFPPRGMMRGGPRGMGFPRMPMRGMPMRGGRPPMHVQVPKVHTGAENNKTVTPIPAAPTGSANSATTNTNKVTTSNTTEVSGSTTATSPPAQPQTQISHINGGAPPSSYRGVPRGRGMGRGGRGGGYSPYPNGGSHLDSSGQIRRGGPPRGRGGYPMQNPRPPMSHNANTQVAPVPTLKRGASSGPPGPKRGRYDQGPHTRPMGPRSQHHSGVGHQSGYDSQQTPRYQSHQTQGYQNHDQMHQMDPYSQQSYTQQSHAYNGYGQTYGSTGTAASGYGTGTEYDQSQYQSYNYNTQDPRYAQTGFSQDYSQTYATTTLDYTSPPPDYTQQSTTGYDERTYTGYDTSCYSQSYSNSTGYY